MTSSTHIAFNRPREWFGRFRKLAVLVDGEVAARVGIGETAVIGVMPGQHRLQAKMDWCTSPELEILVEENVTRHFRSKSPSWWRAPKMMRTQPDSFFQLLPDDAAG